MRSAAAAEIASYSTPTSVEELWRYSRIDELDVNAFGLPSGELSGGLSGEVADFVDAIGKRASVVVTENGRVSKVEVTDEATKTGLTVRAASEIEDGTHLILPQEGDYFTQLNLALLADSVLIDVPRGSVVQDPIIVVHRLTQDGTIVCPRVTVRMGENAQATILEYYVSDDIKALAIPVTSLQLDQAANLRYVSLQSLGINCWQIGMQMSNVHADANLSSTAVAFGAHYARLSTNSYLMGKGATSRLNAVYFAADSQMHDFRTLQAHDAPKTTSDLLFKGAVGGEARSVYSGLIRVSKGAAGTNAFQTNRNLVLSPSAHADSVPNLEIEENDVRCSHASAVGPIDEEQRYYLESRGVPTDVADRLIVLGFLEELLLQIPIEGLHAQLEKVVSRKLNDLDMNQGNGVG